MEEVGLSKNQKDVDKTFIKPYSSIFTDGYILVDRATTTNTTMMVVALVANCSN
jgi:hypothetical protein